MICLFQRDFHTSVGSSQEGKLKAQTKYRDTRGEAIATLLIDRKTFNIEDATLTLYRDMLNEEIMQVDELLGIKAYLGTGLELKRAFVGMDEPFAAPLFAETIRGIIQAETFIFNERGYSSMEEYSRYWEDMYRDSCRYYSNLDRIKTVWDHYVPGAGREGYLFLRYKSYFLYSTGEAKYFIAGSISDTFHEMNACLRIAGEEIISVEGSMLRVPDEICKEATGFFTPLTGRKIINVSKKEISAWLGRGQGCVHLIDLFDDAVKTLKYYRRHPWD